MITRHLNLECLVRTYSIDQKKLSGLETSSCIFLVFSKKHCIHYIVVLLFTDLDFRQNQFHHYKDIIDDVKKNNTGLIAVTLSKKNLQLHLFFFTSFRYCIEIVKTSEHPRDLPPPPQFLVSYSPTICTKPL